MKTKHPILKKTALLLAFILLAEAIFPPMAMALTSGPAQPEFQGFQQVGASNMVDLFSGDFNYNIPLFDVGGYPLNLSYSSNARMDDEASWVGLGWSLNPGAINRQMRGLPDDFQGEQIKREFNLAPDQTVGVSFNPDLEFFGTKKIKLSPSFTVGMTYNSRRGYEMTTGLNVTSQVGKGNKGLTSNLGLTFSPSAGLRINPSIGLQKQLDEEVNSQYNLGLGLNSRQGFSALTLQGNASTYVKGAGASSAGLAASFGLYSYTPTSLLPLRNESYVFNLTLGKEVPIGLHPNLRIEGFYSKQELAYHRETQLAYGYLHLKEGKENKKALLDYNSEISGQLKANTPHLPIAYGTYDMFSISGHGIGGQFRAMRNDIGVFRPGEEKNNSSAASFGLEIGIGGYVHGGADITVTESETNKGEWNPDHNLLSNKLEFTENENNYEAVYFQSVGEQTALNETELYANIGKTDPVRIDNRKNSNLSASSRLYQQSSTTATKTGIYPNQTVNENRTPRNQVISYLTAEEASKVGLDKKIYDYKGCETDIAFSDCASCREALDRTDKPDHHISEITVTKDGGARYVYGLPVYNNLQRDVTFSIGGPDDSTLDPTSEDYGLVSFLNQDASINNNIGKEKYFDATEIPPYAHSYLITGLLSPDYVDKTGDGISEDDIGTAVKFNYKQHNNAYKWRIPVKANKAKFHEGLLSTEDDDKASYLYGEKELWYVHTIESRTMVAKFYTSPRKDGLGVFNQYGRKNDNMDQLKLDKISLFSKADLKLNEENAIPIKNIHFEYKQTPDGPDSYRLCKGVPNHVDAASNQGKLTLEKVYFTYGRNESGALNAYKFDYKTMTDDGQSLDYNIGHYDRWGFYQKNPSNFLANHLFPYVLQGDNGTKEAAGAWNLNTITLPSGAKISVEYEPDDYAYVQDKRAGQMMQVIGFWKNKEDSDSPEKLYEIDQFFPDKTIKNKKYVVVKLPTIVNSLEEAQKRYLEGIEQVYFDIQVELNKNNNSFHNDEERVKGYFTIDGLPELVDNDKLLLPVKYLNDSRGNKIHPIVFAALQKLRLERQDIIYPGFEASNPGVAVIKGMVGLAREIGNFFKGFEVNAMYKKYAQLAQVDETNVQSWVRLTQPDFKKYGGGSRVREVTISDEWNVTDNDDTSEYGQRYEYEIETTINGVSENISSGVACYEPGIGGEENMMKLALPYEEKLLLAPKNQYYSETPIGESLFPAPMVGYSQVKVTDIANFTNGISRSKSGHTIHQFYTAKDFPTIVRTTEVNVERVRSLPIPILRLFKNKDGLSMTQGVTVETNDMHGKTKKQTIYDKDGSLLSSSEYHFKTDSDNIAQKQLDNKVSVIKKDGDIASAELGVCMDTWVEMLEENNNTVTGGVAANVDVIPLPFFGIPLPIPVVLPKYQSDKTQFKAATITKCVQRTGILDSVTVMENGSIITTKNQLFDEATGAVLLTETENEFDAPIYNFNYPAHWAYKGMSQAYQNIGNSVESVQLEDGIFEDGFDAEQYFYPGDELLLQSTNTGEFYPERYFVVIVNEAPRGQTANFKYKIIDNNGLPFKDTGSDLVNIKIIRSNFRNLASTSIGQVNSLVSPVDEMDNFSIDENKKVLNASALTFDQYGYMNCELTTELVIGNDAIVFQTGQTINPYTEGGQGNWRPHISYVYYDNRTPNDFETNGMQIENTGDFASMTPFWKQSGDAWTQASLGKWTRTNTANIYDSKGNELENLDALGIFSAAVYGFKKYLPVGIANNAAYQEIAIESFEDYAFINDCEGETFDKSLDLLAPFEGDVQLKKDIAHTGKFSLEIGAGQFAKYMTKLDISCPVLALPFAPQAPAQDNLLAASSGRGYGSLEGKYFSDCLNCLPILAPTIQKDYNLSVWVTNDSSLICGAAPKNIDALVTFQDIGGDLSDTQYTVNLTPTGSTIEGWQRMEGKVATPDVEATDGPFYMTIKLANNHPTETAYFDDFRFHPFTSNMQGYVYDTFSERLMATLDENNYASFYEYNDEGLLVRTKRETEKGIVTIQEGRNILKSNNSID